MEATDASRLVCVVVVSYQEYSLTHSLYTDYEKLNAFLCGGRAQREFFSGVPVLVPVRACPVPSVVREGVLL